MGYTTEFAGQFNTNKPVEKWFMDYINQFSLVRHMDRDVDKIKEIFPNWKDLGFKGNLGENGEFFIGGTGEYGQDHDESIVEYNRPGNCPGLWCQWMMDENQSIIWDGGEKFYNYVEWINYLIDNFFQPEGYVLNGSVEWQGEDSGDFGVIEIENNIVTVNYGIKLFSLNEIDTKSMIEELEFRGYKVTKI